MAVVMLVAGHGGHDPATSGFGLLEKDLALNIAERVQSSLSKSDITVHMSRTTDTFVALSERARMATAYDANLFVFFHHNAGGGEGFESYIYPGYVTPKLDPCRMKCTQPPWDFMLHTVCRTEERKKLILQFFEKLKCQPSCWKIHF